jgi:hypothetical protein
MYIREVDITKMDFKFSYTKYIFSREPIMTIGIQMFFPPIFANTLDVKKALNIPQQNSYK